MILFPFQQNWGKKASSEKGRGGGGKLPPRFAKKQSSSQQQQQQQQHHVSVRRQALAVLTTRAARPTPSVRSPPPGTESAFWGSPSPRRHARAPLCLPTANLSPRAARRASLSFLMMTWRGWPGGQASGRCPSLTTMPNLPWTFGHTHHLDPRLESPGG